MSELVAVAYPDVYRAGEACAKMQRLLGKRIGKRLSNEWRNTAER